jgi:hypothetical protein
MTVEEQIKLVLQNPNSIIVKAHATDVFEEVVNAICEEQNVELLDKELLKQAEDWSILANQVVGSENF